MGVFLRFLNYENGAKLRKASHLVELRVPNIYMCQHSQDDFFFFFSFIDFAEYVVQRVRGKVIFDRF